MPIYKIIKKLKDFHNIFIFRICPFIIFLTLIQNKAWSKLEKVEYFASLRATQTNVRSGPGSQYPVKFSFKMKGIPVKVINKYDNWSEIEDWQGDYGWINDNLLTKKRTIITDIKEDFVNIHIAATKKSKVILRVENNVVADFIKCNNNSWCIVKISGKKGWIHKNNIWGES